ncbi:MAG: TonB-dependent receptor [Alphaproteobacteria bacterium]|nr:TonB-dependent receptor [Alphaproteobacteria bacterium]
MSIRRRLLASVSVSAGLGLFVPGQVLAVDEIIVTAQKRAESILDVPIAITAVTGEFLAETGITELDDVSDYVPGFQLQIQSVNTPSYVIRGITSDVSEPNAEPNISVFFDGVPGSRGAGSIIELFDLERIEVAKGPQGTLFSRGASNGAINFIMKKPEDEFGGSARVEFGNYESRRYEGILNLPVVEDKLLTRFGAVYHEREGYSDNLVNGGKLNGKESLQLRGSVTVRPSASFEYTVLGYHQRDNPDPTGFKTLVPALTQIDPLTSDTDPFGDIANDADAFLERDVTGITGLGEWDLTDALTLAFTTGYREFSSEDRFDPDGVGPISIPALFVDNDGNPFTPPVLTVLGTPLTSDFILAGVEDDEGDLFSHEFRLNFDNGGRIRGFGGVSYYSEEVSRGREFSYNQGTGIAALGSVFFPAGLPAPLVPSLPFLPTVTEQTTLENSNESYSVYGDVTFDVTERFSLTAGLRWTVDNMEFSYRSPAASTPSALVILFADIPGLSFPTNPFAPGFFGPGTQSNPFAEGALISLGVPGFLIPLNLETNALEGTTNGQTLTTEEQFDYLEPRLIAQFDITPDWMAYASWSSGVRSGGLDIDPRQGLSESQYRRVIRPERVTSYELGSKGSFDALAGSFQAEGAVFYYDYEDFQSLLVQAGSLVPVNTGKASAIGAEAALRASWENGFSAFGNVAYLDGGYDEGVTADLLGNTVDLEGNSFRLTPKWTLSGGLSYQRPLTPDISAFGSILATHKSDFFFNPENEPNLAQDAYTIVTLNLGLTIHDRWELRGRVENLFDEDYLLDAGNTGRILGIPTSIRGQPRLWTIGLGVKF